MNVLFYSKEVQFRTPDYHCSPIAHKEKRAVFGAAITKLVAQLGNLCTDLWLFMIAGGAAIINHANFSRLVLAVWQSTHRKLSYEYQCTGALVLVTHCCY